MNLHCKCLLEAQKFKSALVQYNFAEAHKIATRSVSTHPGASLNDITYLGVPNLFGKTELLHFDSQGCL